MELVEATSLTKALLLNAASMAGLEVSPYSPERFVDQVKRAFDNKAVHGRRRPEAVANLLKWMAATLEVAQQKGEGVVDVARSLAQEDPSQALYAGIGVDAAGARQGRHDSKGFL